MNAAEATRAAPAPSAVPAADAALASRPASAAVAEPARRAAVAATVLFVAVIAVGVAERIAAGPAGTIDAAAARDVAQLRIDPNTASAAALQLLPEVGPALAAAIVDYRERAAPRRAFSQIGDFDAVRGVGPLTLREMRPFLAFEPAAERP